MVLLKTNSWIKKKIRAQLRKNNQISQINYSEQVLPSEIFLYLRNQTFLFLANILWIDSVYIWLIYGKVIVLNSDLTWIFFGILCISVFVKTFSNFNSRLDISKPRSELWSAAPRKVLIVSLIFLLMADLVVNRFLPHYCYYYHHHLHLTQVLKGFFRSIAKNRSEMDSGYLIVLVVKVSPLYSATFISITNFSFYVDWKET